MSSDTTNIINNNGCVTPVVISPYSPIRIIRVVINRGSSGPKGDKGDRGLDGDGSFLEIAATFATISSSSNKRFIYVLADETNNGDISLYLYTGISLKFLQTVA